MLIKYANEDVLDRVSRMGDYRSASSFFSQKSSLVANILNLMFACFYSSISHCFFEITVKFHKY